MNQEIEKAAARFYKGLWGFIVEWLRVPGEPPSLPVEPGETAERFRPAPGFLRYLKFWFWLALLPVDGLILIAWIAITAAVPVLGVFLALPALVLAVLPDIIAYVAIHLRYDSTWYVLTKRSMRLRRGIWVIREVTITFENVQDLKVIRGPLQRFFGIADVVVETAGGGSAHGQPGEGAAHRGILEGVADAERIRDLILKRLTRSKAAGLGDEDLRSKSSPTALGGWTEEHLAVLREIRDEARQLAAGGPGS